jgi:(2S)-methylsuccinyl-CoA dehydrogenase
VNQEFKNLSGSIINLASKDLIKKSFLVVDELVVYINELKEPINQLIGTVIKPESGFDVYQKKLHGLAWTATYVEALKQLTMWSDELNKAGRFGEIERILLILGFHEYLNQLKGGIIMSQNELIRPNDLDIKKISSVRLQSDNIKFFTDAESLDSLRKNLVNLLIESSPISTIGDDGLDEDQKIIRDQFYKFSKEKIDPDAHSWHLKDELIPMEIIEQLADMGVFGLTIPEIYGGVGLDKISMCVVSEELSRGYIGVGSLATRTDIASELILCGGNEQQKEEWLPKIAAGDVIPTAVFTEPNVGSNLGCLQTRAKLDGDYYKITGNKTWITHASRADLMTLLARTNPLSDDHNGLSMFLAPKKRGLDYDDFPDDGLKGGEIEVLGYRGMKEYELSFDNFSVKKANLLGNKEGQGFRQLMETFESARIQTAARAIGVAQNAFDLGFRYAQEREQFHEKLINFPRVRDKLANMAVEIVMARQLTYFSARSKDMGKRCDLEAGMAKLLAARVAWSAADNSLQIHGGNGFALEYPISRVLCDARILNIFEGAAEIQAQVIAKRLLA